MRRWWLWLGLSLVLVACSLQATQNSSPTPTPTATSAAGPKWLVLYYGSADCNLEGHMMDDLHEMISVGSSPEVELLALVDRSPKNSKESGYSDERLYNLKSWSGARLLHPQGGRVDLVEDWGSTNMADGKVFSRFLGEGLRRYPDRQLLVILSGHGAGPTGMMVDDDSDAEDDLLTPQELAQCFQEHRAHCRLLGLDACSMSHLQVARSLEKACDVLVASQEAEPESGWDYATLLRSLQTRPDMTGVQIGGVVAKSYQRSFNANLDPAVREEGKEITLSVLRSDRLAGVEEALQKVARVALQAKNRQLFEEALESTPRFGVSDPPEEGEVPFYDVRHLAERLSKKEPYRQAAGQLLRACEECICSRVEGQDRPSGGLSIGNEEPASPNTPWGDLCAQLHPASE